MVVLVSPFESMLMSLVDMFDKCRDVRPQIENWWQSGSELIRKAAARKRFGRRQSKWKLFVLRPD